MDYEVETLDGNLDILPLEDFHCLKTFYSGVESMDVFIQGDFRLSVENHYCSAYIGKYNDEVVAVFALSFDSLDLDSDDKEELMSGISTTRTPDVEWRIIRSHRSHRLSKYHTDSTDKIKSHRSHRSHRLINVTQIPQIPQIK